MHFLALLIKVFVNIWIGPFGKFFSENIFQAKIFEKGPCNILTYLYNRVSQDNFLQQWQGNNHFHTNRHVQINVEGSTIVKSIEE